MRSQSRGNARIT